MVYVTIIMSKQMDMLPALKLLVTAGSWKSIWTMKRSSPPELQDASIHWNMNLSNAWEVMSIKANTEFQKLKRISVPG